MQKYQIFCTFCAELHVKNLIANRDKNNHTKTTLTYDFPSKASKTSWTYCSCSWSRCMRSSSRNGPVWPSLSCTITTCVLVLLLLLLLLVVNSVKPIHFPLSQLIPGYRFRLLQLSLLYVGWSSCQPKAPKRCSRDETFQVEAEAETETEMRPKTRCWSEVPQIYHPSIHLNSSNNKRFKMQLNVQ